MFLAADGTPWIRTDPSVDVNDDDIRWHRAPRAVFDQLARGPLLGPAPTGPTGDRSRWSAVPGLVAGLVLGALGTTLLRREAARHEPGPPRERGSRQDLIDV